MKIDFEKFLFLVSMLSLNSGCMRSLEGRHQRYYYEDKKLVREIKDEAGIKRSIQYLDKDTLPDGAFIEYYENGKIEKWKWFERNNRTKHPDSLGNYERHISDVELTRRRVSDNNFYPECIVYYDTSGAVDTFVGNPFLGKYYDLDSQQLWIRVINPPNVSNKAMYLDKLNEKVIHRYFYNAVHCSDSGCYISLHHHKPERGHNYYIRYFFMDSLNHPLFSTGTQLVNDSDIAK